MAEDGIESVRRRTGAGSATVDLDETDATGFQLPDADLSGEELTVAVVPMLEDEFRCSRCYLIRHRSQRAAPGTDHCQDCT